jgi:dTDP-4-amino-4,6-dideoxygalactose transaminase
MVVTNDHSIAETMRMNVTHGSKERYKHEILGLNSRLDTLQAAMLRVKLRYLDKWISARRECAKKYNDLFTKASLQLPYEAQYGKHVYHQYTLRLKNRDQVAEHLRKKNIPHAIYYPIPLHLQTAYRTKEFPEGSLPITENIANEVLSLPMHTELDDEQQEYIAKSVIETL